MTKQRRSAVYELGRGNPAPKHCGRHMRKTSTMPPNLKGFKLSPGQAIWRCLACGTVTIKGAEDSGLLPSGQTDAATAEATR